jgi:hypothetical protein
METQAKIARKSRENRQKILEGNRKFDQRFSRFVQLFISARRFEISISIMNENADDRKH